MRVIFILREVSDTKFYSIQNKNEEREKKYSHRNSVKSQEQWFELSNLLLVISGAFRNVPLIPWIFESKITVQPS